jgi:hypothetical protein
MSRHQSEKKKLVHLTVYIISYYLTILIKENARDSPSSVLLAFSQSYVEHDLGKNKIVVASNTRFFRH